MADDREEYRGWRVIEGPGTQDIDENEEAEGPELGESPALGAGYGASTGGVEGEPGLPGPALNEIPEHTGPNAVAGIDGLATEEESSEQCTVISNQ